jgi:protein-arginine deiminase
VVIDTSWLLVGHADETMHVVRSDNARGWTLMVADPLLALEELRKAPETEFFAGTPDARPVDSLLADPTFAADNAEAAAHIDAQVAIMLRETGLRPDELVRVPVLFHKPPSVGLFVAYSPGIPNGISFTERTFAAPDPHAPVVGGRDIFQVATERALRENGVRVRWVENLGWAHYGGGEVHCTTNAWRDTSGQRPWWRD